VKGEKLDISDIRGIIGRGKVKLQDIEDALGKEQSLRFVGSNIFVYQMAADPKF
jgi:hypothetical protein